MTGSVTSWHRNPGWWAIVASLFLSLGSFVFQLCGDAVGGYFGTQNKVDRLESRVVAIEKSANQFDEVAKRIAAQLVELESVKRSLEVLKKELLPISTGDIATFRLDDRDKIASASREIAAVQKRVDSLDLLTAMHSEQLNAVRDMLKDLLK